MLIAGNGREVRVECLLAKGARTTRASIVGVRNGLFELCSPAALKPGQQLTIRHPERLIQTRVAYCKRQENGIFRAGVLMASDAERRSEVRTPVDFPATLRLSGSSSSMPVRVIDISNSGVGIEMPAAVAVGARVHVELTAGTAIGDIRHCARRRDVYRAGIQMREFALPPNGGRRLSLDTSCKSGNERAMESLARSVQERQFRYEAILYSLALPLNG